MIISVCILVFILKKDNINNFLNTFKKYMYLEQMILLPLI